MTFIEGVGDEVTQFFGVILIITLGMFAWWSTGIREIPQIRTVLILERRSQNVTTQQPNLLSEHVARIDTGQGNQSTCQQRHLTTTSVNNKREILINSDIHFNTAEGSSNSRSANANENRDEASEPQETNNPPESEGSTTNNTSNDSSDNIRIRLKYLNDDQKLVEGRLQELLGDFKRRHFSMELSGQKLVRLIFNGQVLQRDDQTLEGCGLYDNCVVHCLVHQRQQSGSRSGGGQREQQPPVDWNLGGLLYCCLSVLLALAWLSRYNYSHLFNPTTTTVLVGLTALFAVAVVGSYHQPAPIAQSSHSNN